MTNDEKPKSSAIWIEKYRPSTFDEIKGQHEIKKKVQAFIKQGNMPHLMFSGPAGTGKSTMALVVAKQMFKENWRQNFLELNASDERGIDVVRHKVKDFARTRALGDVPFKVIFLDESDALTKEAQQALRRTMENYTQTCRFILSNNYSSKIIDPIQSRCTVFRFRSLEKADILEIIDHIVQKENLEIEENAKQALFDISKGDCRRLENIMQSCSAIDSKITEELVFSMASIARPKEIQELLELAMKNKFMEARNKLLDVMLKYGLSGTDIIKQIQSQVMELDIDDRMKVMLVDKCGEIEFRMTEGSDEYLQLEALLANFTLCSLK
ncbi:replication factor C small subunit [Candidatus Woesearchaeota archaeon]|jgi:replication factor C small subunit|nr:replication factor C small subunit [Candidatus Woesearchaeota archaeon]MBT5271940.1 replication factor C small subunit [Candidatus Woesearchaeota archaeon]MBT6041052.1 replication factor C small subunit [Candidatus Woesearchaeota archaeon]MBT6336228.1 replication factor C small subunit [Candidatus Woesearchaeota archaeon]MBT7928005.1 replication factor C small subunit [Candidatus Woesearchaeota archaeon]